MGVIQVTLCKLSTVKRGEVIVCRPHNLSTQMQGCDPGPGAIGQIWTKCSTSCFLLSNCNRVTVQRKSISTTLRSQTKQTSHNKQTQVNTCCFHLTFEPFCLTGHSLICQTERDKLILPFINFINNYN